MSTFYTIMTILYSIVIAIFAIFILFNMFKTRKVTSKIIGALALVMFLLRLFLIK